MNYPEGLLCVIDRRGAAALSPLDSGGLMKIAACVGSLALAVSGVASAHAQDCEDLNRLMNRSHAQVKALQGAQIKDDPKELTFTPKSGIAGFTNCRLMSAKEADSIDKYWKHHLWCEGYSATADSADDAIAALWNCAKDSFSKRQAAEAWIGGRYRVIGFEAELRSAGRAAGLVEFTRSDYARVTLEKSYDLSDKSNLHIYWMFTQPAD
jgi:hypothetical protein